ncbi:MAG: hypothetical protein Kow00109_20040 [Acidobacteriota bacterium]
MGRRVVILGLAAVLLAGEGLFASPPNVLLFTIDSCRADRFGTYGGPEDTTPSIDRWARSGTVFTQAYSVSAWTAPGLVSILSGFFPAAHGVDNRDHTAPVDLPTLPKLFAAAGYRVPNLNFFTFAPYYHHLGLPEIDRNYVGPRQSETLPKWLEDHAAGDQPFFVWFHTTMVHQPYRPDPADFPAPREELEKSPGLRAVLRGAIVPLGSVDFDPAERTPLLQLYDAELRRVDRLFSRVLEILSEKGQLENTLIVLTADHGEELLDHGFVGHASTSLQAKLYEEIVRIPLIVSWTGKVPAGAVVGDPVSQVDVLPTILRLVGLAVPEGIQGRDLWESPPDRELVFESVIAGNQTPKEREDEWVRAIRRGRWKYVDRGELYDLVLDPGERVNLAGELPEVAADLKAALDRRLIELRQARERFRWEEAPPAARGTQECPRIYTPEPDSVLEYDVHTGALLFDWSGDMETTYWIEYDIGRGDHHVSGKYEVQGNHHILGPLPRELWTDLKAWNPFRIRVSPKQEPPCWSQWVEFRF